MENDKVTFKDDFNQGFGFGLGFCLAVTVYGLGWLFFVLLAISELPKRPLP